MDNIIELVNGLLSKNDKAAYKCLKELMSASEQDNRVYQYFDTFADDNSYVRTRGRII